MKWSLMLLGLAALVQGQELCLSGDDDPYFLFGTKTAYTFANKGIPDVRLDVPGCQPIAIFVINRHGSHNPEADEIDGLQSLTDLKNNIVTNYRNGHHNSFNERICPADRSVLENWSWNPRINQTFAGDLTSDGYLSAQQQAQKWRQRAPGLFTNNQHDYLFKYVNNERLKTTYQAFTEGLFRSQAEDLNILKENNEKILMPQKSCNAWINNVEKNNETLSQRYIFESKREFKEMITNISRRLGFGWDIHQDIVQRIYQMCRYNKAWDVSQISPWCVAFSREDLRRLEYAEDLETYYKYGYGSDINAKIGCTKVKDMMDFFTNHVEHEPQQPRTVVHFTDAATLLQTLAAMQVHRDNAPLTGDNYHTNTAQGRKWTTSSMVPFNANIAAVLYKCTPNGNFQINDRYQVLFLENDKTMYLEGCKVGLCDWSYVKNRFGEVADKCNLEVCNGAAVSRAFVGIILVAVFSLLW